THRPDSARASGLRARTAFPQADLSKENRSMLFRLFHKAHRKIAAKPVCCRPRLEAAADRCLLSAGALDPTFGSGAGYVTTSLSKGSDVANAVLIQPWDSKIVVAGTTVSGSATVMSLARYNADGS